MAVTQQEIKAELIGYRYVDKTFSHVEAALKNFSALKLKRNNFVHTNGAIEELACLRGTIPVHFKGSEYNIPVGIFLLKEYPYYCPRCMVTPTSDMMIKPSQYIDIHGKVFLPYLHEWNHETSDLITLIQFMSSVFSEKMPVFSSNERLSPLKVLYIAQEKKAESDEKIITKGACQGETKELRYSPKVRPMQQPFNMETQQMHLAAPQGYNMHALVSQVEHLIRNQASLQSQNQHLALQLEEQQKHFQQQLTDQLAEQRRVIQEEMQQQFQALLCQVESHNEGLQTSWSIAEHHIQVTDDILGRGAWGEVRVGIYQGTRVAVKKMHDVIISNHNHELFHREMTIASRIRHPNLVLFIGAVNKGRLTIVSELMDLSLRKLMEEEKLTVSNFRPISKDVACALVYLHSLPDPIVHRDVSSANVLLHAKQDGWCAKLGDFGSANFLAKLGTVGPGCIAYSAPEAGNPSQQGPKMDVYSFGVLLLEMCVGQLIGQHNFERVKSSVCNWNDSEKKSLGEWALRCTKRNPHERPNMAEFVTPM